MRLFPLETVADMKKLAGIRRLWHASLRCLSFSDDYLKVRALLPSRPP